jgi:hypothetical protein
MKKTHARRNIHVSMKRAKKNRGSVSRYQRVRGESDVKGDVSGGSHEDDGEELKGLCHVPISEEGMGEGQPRTKGRLNGNGGLEQSCDGTCVYNEEGDIVVHV